MEPSVALSVGARFTLTLKEEPTAEISMVMGGSLEAGRETWC